MPGSASRAPAMPELSALIKGDTGVVATSRALTVIARLVN